MKIPEIITELEKIIDEEAKRREADYSVVIKAYNDRDNAREAAERACKAQDADAYHKAQDAARMAEDTIKMHNETTYNKRMITREEYDAKRAEIRAELDAIRAAAVAQIDAQRAEIAKIARAALPVAEEGNKALHLLDMAYYTSAEWETHIEERYRGMDFMKDLAREAPAEK